MLEARDLAAATARLLALVRHFAGGDKDFENVIAGPVGHVFEATRRRRAIVGGGVEVDSEIYESSLWALQRSCLCDCALWSGICVDQSRHDVSLRRGLGGAAGSESASAIDLLRLLKLSRRFNLMILKEISCEVRRRRRSFVYDREMRRWI